MVDRLNKDLVTRFYANGPPIDELLDRLGRGQPYTRDPRWLIASREVREEAERRAGRR